METRMFPEKSADCSPEKLILFAYEPSGPSETQGYIPHGQQQRGFELNSLANKRKALFI